jgi:hypothetical protein
MKVIDPGLFEVIVGGNSGSAPKQSNTANAALSCTTSSNKDVVTTVCDAGNYIVIHSCRVFSANASIKLGNKAVGATGGAGVTAPVCSTTSIEKGPALSVSSSSKSPVRNHQDKIMLPDIAGY